MDEVLNVDFEGRPAEDADLDGIKVLLKQLFLKGLVDVYELSKIIISQNYIGSILQQVLNDEDEDDDEDDELNGDTSLPVFGILTIINISERKNEACINQLMKFILSKVPDESLKEVEKLLSQNQVGVLINERILQAPQLACPSFKSLLNDMKKACQKKMNYNFDKLILLTRSSRPLGKSKGASQVQLTNPEDAIFLEECDLVLHYSVQGQHDSMIEMGGGDSLASPELLDSQFEPMRTLMVVDARKMQQIVEKMKNL